MWPVLFNSAGGLVKIPICYCLAPAALRRLTISLEPLRRAIRKAVSPLSACKLTSTPASKRDNFGVSILNSIMQRRSTLPVARVGRRTAAQEQLNDV